ncbi:hypothetical protein [Fusobacterium russii]|uniref:hypothetical protein n=1 Tax=Fusobacterium russii TaxID=854 RepID=UPI00039EDF75|nr:hypothetical protein [Fusobacterium russii]
MKFENILITDLIYKDKILYIYLRHYYTKDKYCNKILKLKNVKKFTHFLSEFYITFLPEFLEVEEELKIHFFSRPFYRNKKRKQLYIFDRTETFVMIEFKE